MALTTATILFVCSLQDGGVVSAMLFANGPYWQRTSPVSGFDGLPIWFGHSLLQDTVFYRLLLHLLADAALYDELSHLLSVI